MRAAATVVLAKRTPCAWKENTVLSITFAAATVALENDRSATKLPHLNSDATVHYYHMMVQHGTVVSAKRSAGRLSKLPTVSPEPNDRLLATPPIPVLHIQQWCDKSEQDYNA